MKCWKAVCWWAGSCLDIGPAKPLLETEQALQRLNLPLDTPPCPHLGNLIRLQAYKGWGMQYHNHTVIQVERLSSCHLTLPARSTASSKVTSGYSGLQQAEFWLRLRMEILQCLWVFVPAFDQPCGQVSSLKNYLEFPNSQLVSCDLLSCHCAPLSLVPSSLYPPTR